MVNIRYISHLVKRKLEEGEENRDDKKRESCGTGFPYCGKRSFRNLGIFAEPDDVVVALHVFQVFGDVGVGFGFDHRSIGAQ